VRAVLDTNTVVSGFLWGGNPGRLLDFARAGKIRVYTTAELIAELEDVLNRPKLSRQVQAKGGNPQIVIAKWAEMTEVVTSARGVSVVDADPDDNAVIACAVAALADLVISGDKHLLDLKQYGNARIVNAAEAVTLIELGSGGKLT
jgi:putative PIN family toxin of toxin-antitoxin system